MTTKKSAILVHRRRIVVTKRARAKLNLNEMLYPLTDHVLSDEIYEAQVQTKPQQEAESSAPQLQSKFVSRNGTEFLIITMPDRSLTIIDSAE